MSHLSGVLLVLLSALAVAPWWHGWSRGTRGRRGARRPNRSRVDEQPPVDPAVVLDLAAAALDAGASIPRALTALADALDGARVGGSQGAGLRRAASALIVGSSWQEAWSGAPERLHGLAAALEPAWVDGVAAGPLLTRAADRLRAGQARAAEEAAARLGVRLVLPLGLCFLPSFVLLGLVPVVLSAGAGLFG